MLNLFPTLLVPYILMPSSKPITLHTHKYEWKPRTSSLGDTVMPANSKNVYSDNLKCEEILLYYNTM